MIPLIHFPERRRTSETDIQFILFANVRLLGKKFAPAGESDRSRVWKAAFVILLIRFYRVRTDRRDKIRIKRIENKSNSNKTKRLGRLMDTDNAPQ